MLYEDLLTLLDGETDAGSSIYPQVAPDAQQAPYIVYQRVAASSDERWTALGRDQEIARKAARVSEAIAELAKIPGTELPVMAELPDYSVWHY